MKVLADKCPPSQASMLFPRSPLPYELFCCLSQHRTRRSVRVDHSIVLALKVFRGDLLHSRESGTTRHIRLILPVTSPPIVQWHVFQPMRYIQTLIPVMFAVCVLSHLVVLLLAFCVLDQEIADNGALFQESRQFCQQISRRRRMVRTAYFVSKGSRSSGPDHTLAKPSLL